MPRTSHVRQMPLPRIPRHRPSPSPAPRVRHDISSSAFNLRLAPLILSVILCLSGIGVYIWPRVQVVRLAYELQNSEQRLNELLQERTQLQLELASLRDPQRVYEVATRQLGMRAPSHQQRYILRWEPKRP